MKRIFFIAALFLLVLSIANIADARWYDPTMGKFITRDPLGEYGDINLYRYTLNNPVNWVDPYGLIKIMPRDEWRNRFQPWVPIELVDFLYDFYHSPSIGPVAMARKPDIKFIDNIVKTCKLSDTQRRMLHDWITKQNFTKDEIREIAEIIKNQYPKK